MLIGLDTNSPVAISRPVDLSSRCLRSLDLNLRWSKVGLMMVFDGL